MKTKITVLLSVFAIALSLTAGTAQAISTTGNNFTMTDPYGGITGGTNDVVMSWDQQFNTAVSDPVTSATAHMQLSSSTPFFGFYWTVHHIHVFGPGTYTFNVDCTPAQLEAGTCTPNADASRNYTFTVGANQVGAHMLFDWGRDFATPCGKQNCNMDIVNVWDPFAVFGPSLMHTGPTGYNSSGTVWGLMSTDWDGDGMNGGKMIDGPFVNFSANYNLNAVPIPAAFWLFGSGLLGLIGFARRHTVV